MTTEPEYDEASAEAVTLPIVGVDAELVVFVEGDFQDHLTAGFDNMTAWCSKWQEHPDAVHRLAAIHAQWVTLASLGTLGLHEFYRDVLDHHLPALTSVETGPFRTCRHGHHVPHKRIDSAKA